MNVHRQRKNRPGSHLPVSSKAPDSDATLAITVVDFAAIDAPPSAPDELERFKQQMDSYMRGSLADLLSPSDRELFRRENGLELEEKVCQRIRSALDRVILERAPSLRWRLFLSSAVTHRLAQWSEIEEDGPRLFERLGKALKVGTLARQGKAKLPIEPWHAAFKQGIQPELRSLQRLLRVRTSSQHRALTPRQLRSEIEQQVRRPDSPFRHLLDNWTTFDKLLQVEPDEIRNFSIGTRTSAELTNLWMGRVLGRDPESLRITLSKLYGRPRNPSKL